MHAIAFSCRSSNNSNQETTSTDENVNPSNKKLLNVFAHIKDFERYANELFMSRHWRGLANRRPLMSIRPSLP